MGLRNTLLEHQAARRDPELTLAYLMGRAEELARSVASNPYSHLSVPWAARVAWGLRAAIQELQDALREVQNVY